MKCRNCASRLDLTLIDLGSAPLSNAYLSPITLRRPEKWFPLRVLVCEQCWLVQAEAYSRAAEIFNEEYAYYSSFSDEWMEHSERYFHTAVSEWSLGQSSFVLEVASNDGYLLQHFVKAGIPCLGVEPTASTAAAARAKGVPTIERFFGEELAHELVEEYGQADLWVGNNVLAHVPDPLDFLRGVSTILSPSGVATFEFPHLANLVMNRQFDTIYHEHFAYLSFTAVVELLARCDLQAFRVEELPTHGGSLRVFAAPLVRSERPIEDSVPRLLTAERKSQMLSREYYLGLQEAANAVKNDFLDFLLTASANGKSVIAYGAAAKGNTLLNYAGVKVDLIKFVSDRNPAKQGRYMPGSRIPILGLDAIDIERPDYIVILPWNIRNEIVQQLAYVRDWGAKFVTAIPSLRVE